MDSTDDTRRPVVLCVGGHDPSGGAGILADAEAVQAASAFAVTVITALTEQDSCGLRSMHPQPPEQLESHCHRVMTDSVPRAIKIGLLATPEIARTIGRILEAYPDLPVVLDPVLATGAGQTLVDAVLMETLRAHLIQRCTLITPNLPEARTLTDRHDADACAAALLDSGACWVLITGTHDATERVVNRLYGPDDYRRSWDWPRLPHEYHGSGCTLASAIAARLAHGMDVEAAVISAQAYTWTSLEHAFRTGRCQWTPNRLHHPPTRPDAA